MIHLSEPLVFVMDLMQDFPHPWWVGGGWALDVAAGRVSREHEDLDICIFREHAHAIFEHFSDWRIQIAIPGEHRLVPCTTLEDLRLPRYGLHLHRGDEFLEILLTDRVENQVIYRRDPAIQMPLHRFARLDSHGIPYVAPEWQLLFKAKEGRAKDQADFEQHAPLLDVEGVLWLYSSLQHHLPSSPWLSALQPRVDLSTT